MISRIKKSLFVSLTTFDQFEPIKHDFPNLEKSFCFSRDVRPVWTHKAWFPQIRLRCTLISVAFKSHTEWSSAWCVNASTTVILPTTKDIDHNMNCFCYVVCTLQTSMSQNIAKLLTHPSNNKIITTGNSKLLVSSLE